MIVLAACFLACSIETWVGRTDAVLDCSFTGVSLEQSQALTDKAHIYLTTSGRISMAGLNSHNVGYFAENLDKVVRGQL